MFIYIYIYGLSFNNRVGLNTSGAIKALSPSALHHPGYVTGPASHPEESWGIVTQIVHCVLWFSEDPQQRKPA